MPAGGEHVEGKVHRGLAWIGAAQTLISVLDIVSVLLILRFWVSRTEFGIQSLAYTLYPVLDIAADLGVSAALIQRDDHTPGKLSTVFWWNVLLSLVLAGALLVLGPALGAVHGYPVIGTLLAVYGGKLVFQNVYTIPMTLMKKELRFAELSVIRVVANLVEAVVKITLAALGHALWCFTLAALARVFVTGVLVQARHPWWPRLVFRPREAAEYARFGVRSAASQMLYHLYTNMDYQVVGKVFGPAALGLYKLAYELVLDPVKIISGVVTEIAFPAFARLRHDATRLTEQFVFFMRMNLVTVLPFVALILLVAEDFLALAMGPEWVGAAHGARILCAIGVLRAMSFVCPALLDGVGKPHLTLRYMVVAAVALTAGFVGAALLLGDALGWHAVAWAWAVAYPIAFALLVWLTLGQLQITARELVRRLWGIPACAAIATAVAALVAWLLPAGTAPLLRLGIVAGVLLGLLGWLLARWQGISPAGIARTLRARESV